MNKTGSGPYPPTAHTIVGAGDEHTILFNPGNRPTRQQQPNKYSQGRPKFSVIVNEYVGACFEDHCTIGKHIFPI